MKFHQTSYQKIDGKWVKTEGHAEIVTELTHQMEVMAMYYPGQIILGTEKTAGGHKEITVGPLEDL